MHLRAENLVFSDRNSHLGCTHGGPEYNNICLAFFSDGEKSKKKNTIRAVILTQNLGTGNAQFFLQFADGSIVMAFLSYQQLQM